PLVLTEQIADLASSDADVAGGHIGVFADMPMQFDHERLAEAHHFQIGATLRVEIAAAFGAADRQARQCVLEYLLESQELDGSQQDRRMKPQAALIRA